MVANYCLEKIVNNESLTFDETQRLFQVMSLGGATPAMISAVLTGLKMKGYSEAELKGLISFMNTKKSKIPTDQKVFGIHVDPRVGIECLFTAFVMAALGQAVYVKFPKTKESNLYTALGINLKQTDNSIGYQLSKYKIATSYAKGSSFLKNIREVKNELDFYTILDDSAPFVFGTVICGSYVRLNHKINSELFAKVMCGDFQENILIHNKNKLTTYYEGKLHTVEMKYPVYESMTTNEVLALFRVNLSSFSDDENSTYIKNFCAMMLVFNKICFNADEAFEKINQLQKSGALTKILEELIRETNSYNPETGEKV